MRWYWPWVKRATLDAAVNTVLQQAAARIEAMEAEYDAAHQALKAEGAKQKEQNAKAAEDLRRQMRAELGRKIQLITECETALRYGRVTRYVREHDSVWKPVVTELPISSVKLQHEAGNWIAVQMFVTPTLLQEPDPDWYCEILTQEVGRKIREGFFGAAAYERGGRRGY